MLRWRFPLTMLACSLGVTSAAPDARASDPSDKSAAEALFREGRARMVKSDFAEACPKLAESQRLDPAAGTLMNLGQCYERNHQLASAWVTFTEAAKASAARHRDDWRSTALARVRALEPRLSYVLINVDERPRPEGFVVRRDTADVREPEWGTAIPVDAGTHVVVASANGRVSWSKKVDVAEGVRVTVDVPTLEIARVVALAPTEIAPPRASPEPGRGTPPLRVAGVVALGLGAAGLVTGGVVGILAASAGKEADRACPSSPCSDRAGLDASSRAHGLATASTIGFVAGGALAIGGLALVVWGGGRPSGGGTPSAVERRRREERVRVEAVPGRNGVEVRLVGAAW